MTTAARIDEAVVRAIIIDVLEVEEGDLTRTSLFIEDLGADSLAAIEILSRLEQELGLTIAQEDLFRMTDLDAVLAVLNGAERRQP